MIDLHTHTTASDGRPTPPELGRRAVAAGVTILGVTDHDTAAAADEASARVHVLGYFIDLASSPLHAFLAAQRQLRVDRVREIVEKLDHLGMHLDADAPVQPAIDDTSKSAGRPWIARALVAAGYVASVDLAFQKWLSRGRPAFVPRLAASPEEIVGRIHDAGGVASLAHPGLLRHDEWIPALVNAGLDAIEAYHTEHDAGTSARYVELARRYGALVSGGSDYHGDDAHGAIGPGEVSLSREAYDDLQRGARRDR